MGVDARGLPERFAVVTVGFSFLGCLLKMAISDEFSHRQSNRTSIENEMVFVLE